MRALLTMRVVLLLVFAAMLSGCLSARGGGGGQGVETTTTETLVRNAPASDASTTIAPMNSPPTTVGAPLLNCSKFYFPVDRDACWYARAAQLKDPSLCKRIVQPDAERICGGTLLGRTCTGITNDGEKIICDASLKDDPKRCNDLNHRDINACYLAVAIFNGDAAVCDMARDRDDRAFCHALVGSCGQLTLEEDISLCRQKVADMYSAT
jgi:hypothetical protein